MRRLAEASVSVMKLVSRLSDQGPKSAVEEVVLELYPGYLDQKNGTHKAQAESRHFLTSSKVDRINVAKLKERQTKLLKVIVTVALGLFQSANYQAALVAAQQYLVLIADVHGTNSLELIPAYAMIAELEIKLNKLREAEQQLQKANWVIMQNEHAENVDQVKQKLYRLLGLLHGMADRLRLIQRIEFINFEKILKYGRNPRSGNRGPAKVKINTMVQLSAVTMQKRSGFLPNKSVLLLLLVVPNQLARHRAISILLV